MTRGLRLAIEQLYEAFAAYALRPPPCCEKPFAELVSSKPLHQLGSTDLDELRWGALGVCGDADDLRHYLPRLLELEAGKRAFRPSDPEVVFSHLRRAGWLTWPEAERDAVDAFAHAWWSDVTRSHPHPTEPDRLLCCLGQLVDDLAPYLADWRPDRSRAEALQFAEWVRDVYCGRAVKPMRGWHLRNPWWQGRPKPARQAAEWLLSADRAAELERAFFAFGSDAATAEALSYAVTELQALWACIGVIVDPPG